MLQRNQWNKYGNDNVFKSTLNALIRIDGMKRIYAENGVDLYLNGKKSVITLVNYKEV